MNKFIYKSALFFIPIILMAIMLEIFLRNINTSYSEKEKGLKAIQKEIQVLTLGNSHAALGFYPEKFTLNTFNMANVIQSLYYDKRITLKHLDSLPSLKYVLISLDFTSFYYSRLGSRENWNYYGNGIEFEETMPILSKKSYLMGYSFKIAVNFLKKELSGNYNRIKALDVPEGVDLRAPIIKGGFFYEGINKKSLSEPFCLSKANLINNQDFNLIAKLERIKDLESFVKELKKRKIKPIFITIPCYLPFLKKVNSNLLKQNEIEIGKLAKSFNIPYWNYLFMPLKESDFYDCDHLNISGARKFTNEINLRLNAYNKIETKLSTQ